VHQKASQQEATKGANNHQDLVQTAARHSAAAKKEKDICVQHFYAN